MDFKKIISIIDDAENKVPEIITESSNNLSSYMDAIVEEQLDERFKFRATGNRSSFGKHLKQSHGLSKSTWASSKHGAKKFLKQDSNPVDIIKMDVPLLIRLLEYAREDAQTDMDLHDVSEKLIELSKDGNVLTMDNYDSIVISDENI
jgi:hypothetical protein